jgi:hypothetical protein
MVAGTAAEIGIAGMAAAAISRKRHERSRADGISFPARPLRARFTLAHSLDRYRSGPVAWQPRTARPVHDAAASIYRAGSQGG